MRDVLCNCALSGVAGQRHVPYTGEWHAEPDWPHGPHSSSFAAHCEHQSLGSGSWQWPVSLRSPYPSQLGAVSVCWYRVHTHPEHISYQTFLCDWIIVSQGLWEDGKFFFFLLVLLLKIYAFHSLSLICWFWYTSIEQTFQVNSARCITLHTQHYFGLAIYNTF